MLAERREGKFKGRRRKRDFAPLNYTRCVGCEIKVLALADQLTCTHPVQQQWYAQIR